MKKRATRLLSLLLVLMLILSTSVVAYADKPYSDSTNAGSDNSDGSNATSSKELLKRASNYKKIELPKSSSYFTDYFPMYIDAPKGHSVNVYNRSDISNGTRIDYAYHGSRVYVVGEENDLLCVLYFTPEYEVKAGWVNVDNLNYEYPCETYYPPKASKEGTKGTYNFGDPIMSWSKIHFPGTKTDYSILNDPVEDCVEFTLDYQVISRNGSPTEGILGDRDIYINDGKDWTKIGSIDYDEYAPCHIRVTMDKPVTLYAVATVAHCKSTSFLFRQIVIDIICES